MRNRKMHPAISQLSIPTTLLVLFFSISTTSASSSHALTAFQQTLSTLPSCPLGDTFPIQHTDAVCNRVHSNSHQVRMLRKKPPHLVGISGGEVVSRLAEEATWICPDDNDDDNDDILLEESNGNLIGHMTTWIVKNEASTPISIAYVDRTRNNLEVSAKNGHIHPAHVDPSSILYPGEWTSVNTFQGHVFHVRELVDIGGGGILAPGRILVRHRPGLIPIGGKNDGDLYCPPSALHDPNPSLTNTNHPHQRTIENPNEFCNVLHRGYVNKAKCPIDIYFAGTSATPARTSQCMEKENSNFTSSDSKVDPSMACAETFKMHLGVNPTPLNYLDDWDSPIKFEGSYLAHRFVARLRHDPRVVVEEVVMELHVVRDCPRKKKVVEGRGVVQKESVVQEVEVMVEEKPASLLVDGYVPVVNGYHGNLTAGLYRQKGVGGDALNITAMAAIVDAEEISMVMPEEYNSAKAFAMGQS